MVPRGDCRLGGRPRGETRSAFGAGPACLIACHLAAEGHGRIGLGILLQRLLGLRPSEMLAIQGRDCSLPEHGKA